MNSRDRSSHKRRPPAWLGLALLALWALSPAAAAETPAAAGSAQPPARAPAVSPTGSPPASSDPQAPTAPAPITLTEAVERALRDHPALRENAALVEEGRHRVAAEFAAYHPRVFAGAQWLGGSINGNPTLFLGMPDFPRVTGTGPGQTASGATRNTNFLNAESSWLAGISTNIPITDFGRTQGRVRAAQGALLEREASGLTVRQRVIAGVQRAYYGVLAARAIVGVSAQSVTRLTVYAREAEALVRAKLRAPIDVFRTKAALASARERLIEAQAEEQVARGVLDNALGRRAAAPLEPADDATEWRLATDERALLLLAFHARPELGELRGRLVSMEGRLQAARGGYYPALAGTASVSGRGTGGFGNYFNYDAGALLLWPIFEGYLYRNQALEASAHLKGLGFSGRELLQRIEMEVRTAHALLDTAEQLGAAARAAAVHADENLRLARARFRAGLSPILELADAEELFISAHASVFRAHYDYKIAAANLERAVGRRLPVRPR